MRIKNLLFILIGIISVGIRTSQSETPEAGVISNTNDSLLMPQFAVVAQSLIPVNEDEIRAGILQVVLHIHY